MKTIFRKYLFKAGVAIDLDHVIGLYLLSVSHSA